MLLTFKDCSQRWCGAECHMALRKRFWALTVNCAILRRVVGLRWKLRNLRKAPRKPCDTAHPAWSKIYSNVLTLTVSRTYYVPLSIVNLTRTLTYIPTDIERDDLVYLLVPGWLGSRVFSMLDSGAIRHGFKSQPRRCRVTVLSKLFTPIVPLFTKQRNW